MEAIDRLASIADKVYLGEDFSQEDYNFFCKYLYTATPIWYTGKKEDLISLLFLHIVEGNYDIKANSGWKKRFLETYMTLDARNYEKDRIRNGEGVLVENREDIPDKQENSPEEYYTLNQLREAIDMLHLSLSPIERDILNTYLLSDTSIVEIAKKYSCSPQRCFVKKDTIIQKIKNRIELGI